MHEACDSHLKNHNSSLSCKRVQEKTQKTGQADEMGKFIPNVKWSKSSRMNTRSCQKLKFQWKTNDKNNMKCQRWIIWKSSAIERWNCWKQRTCQKLDRVKQIEFWLLEGTASCTRHVIPTWRIITQELLAKERKTKNTGDRRNWLEIKIHPKCEMVKSSQMKTKVPWRVLLTYFYLKMFW